MSRNAKITLTAEVRGFKQAVGDARKTLEGLGDVKIDDGSLKKLKEALGEELKKRAEDVRAKMEEINTELGNMAKAGDGAFDSKKATEYTRALKGLKETLKEIKETQDKIGEGKIGEIFNNVKGAGGGLADGLKKSLGGPLMKILGPVLGALSVGAIYGRAKQMGEGNMRIRQLTRDGGTVSGMSEYGFTPEERRERGFAMAQAMGGGSAAQVNSMVNLGERVERAYGVSSETSSGFVGAARRAGVANQEKAMSQSIGAAVAAGLEGSKIGEYLGAMTGYMESLSQGVNIDSDSLSGFAGALSSLPFFKNDPNRAFSTIRSLDSTFKGGDAFQTAMANRALLSTGGPMDAASLANRRAAGLFGNTLDSSTVAGLKKAGVNTSGLATSGSDIINGMFKDVMQSTKGMSGDERLNAFRNRLGMNFGDSATIFAQLSQGKGVSKDMVKKFQEAQMSPEDRLNKTMNNMDAAIKKLDASIQQLFDAITKQLVPPLVKLANGLLGMFGDNPGEQIGNAANTVGAVGAGAAGMYAGSKVLGAGKAIGKFGAAVAPKMTAKLGAKLGGTALARATPFLGNAINVGMTGYEAWQIAKTYLNGKDPTPADWAKLGFSAAGIAFPMAGLGAAGIEAAQAMGGLSTSQNFDEPSVGAPNPSPSVLPSPMSSPMNGAMGSDAATIQNTIATQQLTQAILSSKGGMMKGAPSYARPMTGTVGK